MSTQHTPGPWFVEGMDIKAPTDPVNYRLAQVHGGRRGEEREANARLIASAPDLLEALTEARKKLAWFVESYPQDLAVSESEFFRAIDASIAKATEAA